MNSEEESDMKMDTSEHENSGDSDDEESDVPEEEEEDAESWKLMGNTKYKSGDYRGAITCYDRAIIVAPTTSAYYGNRAAANMMLLKYNEVIQDCSVAIAMEPSFLKAYIRKGKAYLGKGDLHKALGSFADGLLRDPNHAGLMNEKRQVELAMDKVKRGQDHLEQKRFGQAISCFDSVLKVATGNKSVKLMRAEALIGKERYDEAFAVLTGLMRTDPNTTEVLYLRARCLYFQGEFANAIRHLKQACGSDPDNSKYIGEIKRIRALENLKEEANASFKAQKWQEAVTGYTECLKLDPLNKMFNAKLHSNRATAYSKMAQYDEAIRDCEKAVYYDASYAKAYLRKAVCLRAKGEVSDLEQAVREYENAMKLVSQEAQRDIQRDIRDTKLEVKKAKRIDYYKVLECKSSATDHEIKKAYKKSAMKHHPDRHATASEEGKKLAEDNFKKIGEAYAVLSDPEKKQRYDSGVDIEDLEHGGHGGHGDVDPSDIFNMFFGGGGGGGGMGGQGRGRSHGHGGHRHQQQGGFHYG